MKKQTDITITGSGGLVDSSQWLDNLEKIEC